jgi:hypothetical protein
MSTMIMKSSSSSSSSSSSLCSFKLPSWDLFEIQHAAQPGGCFLIALKNISRTELDLNLKLF